MHSDDNLKIDHIWMRWNKRNFGSEKDKWILQLTTLKKIQHINCWIANKQKISETNQTASVELATFSVPKPK